MASAQQATKNDNKSTNTVVHKPQGPQTTGAVLEPRMPGEIVPQALENPESLSNDDVNQLQRSVGNQTVSQLFTSHKNNHSTTPVQARLALGPVNDKYEQEADQVASKVVDHLATSQGQNTATTDTSATGTASATASAPSSTTSSNSSSSSSNSNSDSSSKSMQRKEREEEEGLMQMKPVARISNRLRGGGQRKPIDQERTHIGWTHDRPHRPGDTGSDWVGHTNPQPGIVQRAVQGIQRMAARFGLGTYSEEPQREPEPGHPPARQNGYSLPSVQRSSSDGGGSGVSANTESAIQGAKGGGRPLDKDTRGKMEQAMGADFSGVRIHTDARSDTINRSIQARAFTTGNDVFFRSGEYNPGNRAGQELLAHELTHTVQQGAAGTLRQKPIIQRREDGSQATGSTPPQPGGGGADEPAPTSPEEDSGFQETTEQIGQAAEAEQTHNEPESEASAAQAAAESPQQELEGQAQSNQVGEMQQAETPEFDAEAFKAELMSRIEGIAPSTLEEADNFENSNQLGSLKNDMASQVEAEKAESQGPVAEATAEAPDMSTAEPKPVEPLQPPEVGEATPAVGAEGAMPKPKATSEVESPIQEQSQSIDDQMEEAEVTEEQLEKGNEPEFQAALDAKTEAQTHATEAPQEYRTAEQTQLTSAQEAAVETAQTEMEAMHANREQAMSQLETEQTTTKTEDEQKREEVGNHIQEIYQETKTEVEEILSQLDTDVDTAFDTGAAAAKDAFEDYVDSRMDAYKDDRYGGVLGPGRWLKDKLLGMPSEVNRFYEAGRDLYIQQMDGVIDNVVSIIGSGLTRAKTRIAEGKQQIQEYVEQLPEDLREVGEQAAADIQSQFDELEQSVENKQSELIDSLSSKYQENLQAIDARIEELKAANQGLVDKAINAVTGVIQTIIRLKEMLTSVLSRVADVVNDIIKDPIGFLGNLITGLTQGFQNFAGNIMTHLQTGLLEWLTGALGPVGITLPDDLFSLEGIFDLVMQVLGLTWDNIRAKAVQHLGEPMVKALETGFEIFQVLITDGPAGLWEYVKEQFNDLKDQVLEEIKSMIISQVIEAGVKWILGMLNPASAFVKAVMAIYDIVTFFIERASQVMDLVNAVIDSVSAIVGGNVSAMAKAVEDALARALPVVIGFLANLLGLGDLAEKVQNIIKKIRTRIDNAIDSILEKAKEVGKKLLGKGGSEDDKDKTEYTDEDRQKGLQAIDTEEEKYVEAGKIEEDEAKQVAATVKQKHPVFKSLSVIDGGETWDYNYVQRETKKGEEKDDIWQQDLTLELKWPKPATANYPTIYLGGRINSKYTQNYMSSNVGKQVGGHPIKAYTPENSSQTLPGGENIGLASGNQIREGTQVGPLTDATTPGGGKLNRILKKYGFSPSDEQMDADHAKEIQLGGKDEVSNLWPLERSRNRGASIQNIEVTHPDDATQTIKIQELKKFTPKYKYYFTVKF